MKAVYFERALFISWYCSRGDCRFCYMSTQKSRISNPLRARRTKESVLAEALICKALDWKIEFISGGYDSYHLEELIGLIRLVHRCGTEKLWLNVGTIPKEWMCRLLPHIKGVVGAVECVNPSLHDKLCPSKPLSEIFRMWKCADELGLERGMTMIIGLGEARKDLTRLKQMIKEYGISRVTFYRLKPQKGTMFENSKGPSKEDFIWWVKKAREEFPALHITAGSWLTHLDELGDLLMSGADNFTKLPVMRIFSGQKAKKAIAEARRAGRDCKSVLAGPITAGMVRDIMLRISDLGLCGDYNEKVKSKVMAYIKKMDRNV